MYYAEFNCNEELESNNIFDNYARYNNSNEDNNQSNNIFNYEANAKNIVNNNNNNVQPVYDNYYKPQSGYCNMSFGGLIKDCSSSTIVIPVNADLNYDNDCKMGYNTTLLIPITVPTITENSPVIIIPVLTQQNVDKNNKNIINTATQQPILEARLENSKIKVKAIDNITNINKNAQIVTSVTNLNEIGNKIEATTITSLPISPDENKKVMTESNVVNTDISGSNTKTNTNILISQMCLNGSLQCDVKQQINNIKSDMSNNYDTYSESSRTIIDLSSGEISLFKKNVEENISTTATTFINKDINISNNADTSNNILLSNNDNSLKLSIPTDTPTIVNVDKNKQVINTISDAIKISSRDPSSLILIIDRYRENDIDGYSVTPYYEDVKKEHLPTIRNSVITTY
jgi:hypothetical protein